jgi:3'(2'), 5'-bisphosphate nucleotidase
MLDAHPKLGTAALLPQVVEIARRAGESIMAVYADLNPVVKSKPDKSPLTQADLASHRVICDGLSAIPNRFPIVSEESAEISFKVRRTWETFWLVDPLDGTKEFLNRNGEFTVNIALINGGVPVLGVVYVPVAGTTYCAADGVGARKLQRGVEAPIKTAGTRNVVLKVIASRLHSAGMNQTRVDLERFGIDVGKCDFVAMGSSLKFCIVAEGRADAYLRNEPTMEWDTAAAQCVLEMAGGSVTDLEGNRLEYNKRVLLNPSFLASATRLIHTSAECR